MPENKAEGGSCRITANGLTENEICDAAVFWFGGSPFDKRLTDIQQNIIAGWERSWWAACDADDDEACDSVLEHIVRDIFAEENAE